MTPAIANEFPSLGKLFGTRDFTPEVEAALVAMRKLDRGEMDRVYGAVYPETADDWASHRGLRPVQMTEYNVSRLLKGLPEKFIAADDIANHRIGNNAEPGSWEHKIAIRFRLDAAKERRRKLIASLVAGLAWTDHGELFAKDGRPHTLVGQPYHLDNADLIQIGMLADCWDLEVCITTRGWYFAGQTPLVVLSRKD